jgi:hypothetical protein
MALDCRGHQWRGLSRSRSSRPRSFHTIASRRKFAARRAGFRHVGEISGHSFRSGHVNQAVRNGVYERGDEADGPQITGGPWRIYKDRAVVRAEPGGRSLGSVEKQIPRLRARDFTSLREDHVFERWVPGGTSWRVWRADSSLEFLVHIYGLDEAALANLDAELRSSILAEISPVRI